jgi:phage recombination protein Bet
MTTNLTVVDPAPLVTVTPEQLALIKKTIAKDATAEELELFLYDNRRRGIHPLDRLLHFTKRGGKYTPITSIDLMRTRAATTGELAGMDDIVFDGTPKRPDFTATARVYRLVGGQRYPYPATAYWSEYKPPSNDFMWERMPHVMLGKCAEALALRRGFPHELSGLYEAAELAQAVESPQQLAPRAEAAEPTITRPQQRRLFAAATKAGWSNDRMKAALLEQFGLDSTSDIPKSRYDEIFGVFSIARPVNDPVCEVCKLRQADHGKADHDFSADTGEEMPF